MVSASHVPSPKRTGCFIACCVVHAGNGHNLLPVKKKHDHRVIQPQFPTARGNFGNAAINKSYIAYFLLRVCETAVFLLPVKNLTSSSCFSTPIFLNHHLICAWILGPFGLNGGFVGQKKRWCDRHFEQPRFHFWGLSRLCQFWWNATARVRTNGHTHWQTWGKLIL